MAVSWGDLHASARQAVADAGREGFPSAIVAREVRLRAAGESGAVSASIDRIAWLLTGRLGQLAPEPVSEAIRAALVAAETSGDLGPALTIAEVAEQDDQAEGRSLPPAARAQRYYARALRFWELGDLLSAVADVTSALDATPDDVAMLSNRGGWLYNLGSPWAAVADWERAVKLQPEYANGWMKIATVLIEYGQRDRAKVCLQRALDVSIERWPYRETVAQQLRDWEGG